MNKFPVFINRPSRDRTKRFSSLVFLVAACISLLLFSGLAGASSDSVRQVFKLDALLTGEDIHYDRYKEFRENYYDIGDPEKEFLPLRDFKADSKGGTVTFYENTLDAGVCTVVFTWDFGRDIKEVKAGEEIEVTLTYNIPDKKCVQELAGHWIAFSLNNKFFEQFLGDRIEDLLTEISGGKRKLTRGPEGGDVELKADKPAMTSSFKLTFPVNLAQDNFFTLRLTIFRYYYPNTPVAVYVLGGE